jgi:hypothetical protein
MASIANDESYIVSLGKVYARPYVRRTFNIDGMGNLVTNVARCIGSQPGVAAIVRKAIGRRR